MLRDRVPLREVSAGRRDLRDRRRPRPARARPRTRAHARRSRLDERPRAARGDAVRRRRQRRRPPPLRAARVRDTPHALRVRWHTGRMTETLDRSAAIADPLPRWSVADVYESLHAPEFAAAIERSGAEATRLASLFDETNGRPREP